MVINPVISHTASSHPALPTLRVMSALTINIPEPIMEPATIIVASINVRDCLKEVCCSAMWVILVQDIYFLQMGPGRINKVRDEVL